MLMAMMSNGGIGGGVSSAVARALGAGRTGDARALALHAVVVAAVLGGGFSLAAWLGGRALFGLMGGTGDTLENALVYSNVLFASAIPAWIANLLAAALRGAGNVRVRRWSLRSARSLRALSPLFIFGLGVVPGFGVAGAGIAFACFSVGSASCARYACVRHARRCGSRCPARAAAFQGNPRGWRAVRGRHGRRQSTVVVTTGQSERSAAPRCRLRPRAWTILIPLLFALGTASVTMVGTNTGAGQYSAPGGSHGRLR
jgi:Na+-driven multidrug efflux pump